MALSKQDVQVLLGTGIETKQDPKLVQPGKLLVCENSNIDVKTGSSFKRYGHDSLPLDVQGRGSLADFYAPPLTNVQKVTTLNNELVAITNKALYGYSESMQEWSWKGYIGNVLAESQPILRNQLDNIKSDSVFCNGYLITASVGIRNASQYGATITGNDQLVITVRDQKTKTVINEQSLSISTNLPPAGTIYQVRCVTKGNLVFVYYIQEFLSGRALSVLTINTLTPSTIPSPIIITLFEDCLHFDACSVGDEVVVVYGTAGASTNITMFYAKNDGTIGGISTGQPADSVAVVSGFATGSNLSALSICGSNDGVNNAIYVYYPDNVNGLLYYKIYNLSFTNTYSGTLNIPVSVIGLSCFVSGSVSYVFPSFRLIDSVDFNYFFLGFEVTILGSGSGYSGSFSGTVISKPFIVDSDIYLVISNTDYGTEQKSYFVVRSCITNETPMYSFFPVCQIAINEGLSDDHFLNYSSSVNVDENGDLFLTLQRAYTVTGGDGTSIKTAHETIGTTIKINSPDGYQVLEKENCLFITSGILFVYDGNYVFENGFLVYPRIELIQAFGAGAVPASNFNYQGTFEWTDRSGNKHISAPSLNYPITTTGTQGWIVRSKGNIYTYKRNTPFFRGINPLGFNVYRNGINSTVKYKVNLQSPESTSGSSVSNTTFIDVLNDADLKKKEIIYTNGGVIENISSGSYASIEDYQGRILLSDGENGNSILFSKQKRPTLAYQFNPDLIFSVRESSSRVKAAKVLDDKVILFKDTSIYVQAGQGPSDTGQNSDYLQNPQRIAANVGCPYPKSIVRYNDGLLFKSLDGFYHLNRALELRKIGEAVDIYNNLTVREGVLMEDRNEIRWVHSDGVCLIYDYFQEQWYTYTNHEAVSCCLWKKLFVMAKANGEIWVENKSTYLDNGVSFRRRIVTPWFSLAGLQHAERLYRVLLLGEMRSPHRLTMYVSYNYEPARREEFTFNSLAELGNVTLADNAFYTVPATYSTENRTYDIEVRPKIQKCESFRLEIYDENLEDENEDPIDGGCAVWTSLTMTVGVKPSTLRPSSNRRADPT